MANEIEDTLLNSMDYSNPIATVTSGLEFMLTGETNRTRERDAKEHEVGRRKRVAAEKRNYSERAMAALMEDQVSTNATIRLKQEQTKANIEVMAAGAGVKGGAIDSALQSSMRTRDLAVRAAEKQTEQRVIEQNIIAKEAAYEMLGIRDVTDNIVGDALSLGGVAIQAYSGMTGAIDAFGGGAGANANSIMGLGGGNSVDAGMFSDVSEVGRTANLGANPDTGALWSN